VITVTGLSVTPVKATRLQSVQSISLGPDGAAGNRRFFLIDDQRRMINSKTLGALQTIVSAVNGDRLALTFPDGRVVEGSVARGAVLETRFFSRALQAQLVEGPFSEAISSFAGRSLRLVEADGDGAAVDRGTAGTVTLISRASLDRIAAEAGASNIDPRRFRMLIEIDGVAEHEEDAWVGRAVQIGQAVVAFGGHVGRCLITSRDPDTGQIDLPTLDLLADYRRDAVTTEPLPFGIYGAVVEPGPVRVGDPVSLCEP
jgi:uncharacterized protein YcbX